METELHYARKFWGDIPNVIAIFEGHHKKLEVEERLIAEFLKKRIAADLHYVESLLAIGKANNELSDSSHCLIEALQQETRSRAHAIKLFADECKTRCLEPILSLHESQCRSRRLILEVLKKAAEKRQRILHSARQAEASYRKSCKYVDNVLASYSSWSSAEADTKLVKASTMIQEAERGYQKLMSEYKMKIDEWMTDHEAALEGLQLLDEHRYNLIIAALYKFTDSIEVNQKIHQKMLEDIRFSLDSIDPLQDIIEFSASHGTGENILKIEFPTFETIDIKEESIQSPACSISSPFMIQMSEVPFTSTAPDVCDK